MIKICETCGKEFWPAMRTRRFCSARCHPSRQKLLRPPAGDGDCIHCGVSFPRKSRSHKFCSPECGKWHGIEISRKRGRWLILERDNFTCIFCGKTSYADKAKLHIDHIYPERAGGKTVTGNLATCCSRCNAEKHTDVPRACEAILAEITRRNKDIGVSNSKPIKLSVKRYVGLMGPGRKLRKIEKNI